MGPCRPRSERRCGSRLTRTGAGAATAAGPRARGRIGLTGLGVTGSARWYGHGPGPTHLHDTADAVPTRREPVPLEQIPVWDGFVADRRRTFAPAIRRPGLDALPRRAEPGPAEGGHARRRAAARRRRRRAPARPRSSRGGSRWLIATRRAQPSEILALTFTDKAAAEMQSGSTSSCRTATRTARSARSMRSATGSSASTRWSSGCRRDVRVLSPRRRSSIFLREHLFELELDEYRPLGDPTRFLGALGVAVQPLQGRGRLAGAYRACADAARRTRPAARAGRRGARRSGPGASVELADAPTAATRSS